MLGVEHVPFELFRFAEGLHADVVPVQQVNDYRLAKENSLDFGHARILSVGVQVGSTRR